MKYLLMGDLHGARGEDFARLPCAEVFDGLVCVGDFDSPESVLGFLDYYSQFDPSRVFVVPGNHDYCILNGNLPIISPEFLRQGVDYSSLVLRMKESSKARDFLGGIVDETKCDGFFRDFDFEGVSGVAVHGGFDGDLDLSEFNLFQNGDRNLWYRCHLGNPNPFALLNFARMRERGKNILVRGHDHNPFLIEEEDFSPYFVAHRGIVLNGNSFEIDSRKKYILNPGAFCNGNYSVIEKEGGSIKISFRRVNLG